MGLLRAARALFSQKKAVSSRKKEGQPEGRWEPRSNTLSARCDDTRGVDSNVMSEPREGRMSRWRISIGKELRIAAKQTYKSSLVSVHGWKKNAQSSFTHDVSHVRCVHRGYSADLGCQIFELLLPFNGLQPIYPLRGWTTSAINGWGAHTRYFLSFWGPFYRSLEMVGMWKSQRISSLGNI